MNLVFVFLALQVAEAPPAPDLVAAEDYARCIGLTAVTGSARIPSIDEAVRRAFEQCAPKRATALALLTDAFRTGGLSDAEASETAAGLLRDNDEIMSNKLKSHIASYRATGQVPDNASD